MFYRHRLFGAQTPTASVEVPPPSSPRKYWTRRGIAEWLVKKLTRCAELVGIDHGFSFRCLFRGAWLLPDGRPSSTISRAIGRPMRRLRHFVRDGHTRNVLRAW